jgi:hypothetical protein
MLQVLEPAPRKQGEYPTCASRGARPPRPKRRAPPRPQRAGALAAPNLPASSSRIRTPDPTIPDAAARAPRPAVAHRAYTYALAYAARGAVLFFGGVAFFADLTTVGAAPRGKP